PLPSPARLRSVLGAQVEVDGVLDQLVLTDLVLPDPLHPLANPRSERRLQGPGDPGLRQEGFQRLLQLTVFLGQVFDRPQEAAALRIGPSREGVDRVGLREVVTVSTRLSRRSG